MTDDLRAAQQRIYYALEHETMTHAEADMFLLCRDAGWPVPPNVERHAEFYGWDDARVVRADLNEQPSRPSRATPTDDEVERASLALEAKWNSDDDALDGLPPIAFSPPERRLLARAALTAALATGASR